MKKKLNLDLLEVSSFITHKSDIRGVYNLVDQFDSGKRDCDTEKYVCGTE
ncbi:MAG: hypothetical protein WBG62_05345 [Cyclobacteriaceae bacterium]